jgi:hypothetical protein
MKIWVFFAIISWVPEQRRSSQECLCSKELDSREILTYYRRHCALHLFNKSPVPGKKDASPIIATEFVLYGLYSLLSVINKPSTTAFSSLNNHICIYFESVCSRSTWFVRTFRKLFFSKLLIYKEWSTNSWHIEIFYQNCWIPHWMAPLTAMRTSEVGITNLAQPTFPRTTLYWREIWIACNVWIPLYWIFKCVNYSYATL